MRKFKESITPYIHQLYAIYNTILPYTMQSRYSRPSHLVINAIETDMKNGNHNEKLKIIDELTRSLDLIKQSAESIERSVSRCIIKRIRRIKKGDSDDKIRRFDKRVYLFSISS